MALAKQFVAPESNRVLTHTVHMVPLKIIPRAGESLSALHVASLPARGAR